MLFALGLGPSVVAVTHECDFPPGASDLPHLTRSVLPPDLTSDEIDRAVRERTEKGEAIYELDTNLLEELQPDLIVTQQVCEVCAVSFTDVTEIAKRLDSQPEVLSQDPSTIGEVLADIRRLGTAADVEDAADDFVEEAADRLDEIQLLVQDSPRPRVAALEWLDPAYIGGHWVPQMIEMAGGEDALGFPGEKSRTATWDELRAALANVIVAMPCGYYAEAAAAETMKQADKIAGLGAQRVVAVDAAAYFSRPGPRLVEGVELLAHVLHPDIIGEPPPEATAIELAIPSAAAAPAEQQ
jgi:iron complex transport system substrate-binding protein